LFERQSGAIVDVTPSHDRVTPAFAANTGS
jgi:hypothetical protein